MKVGEFLYENLDGTITVKAFDAANNEKWQKQYEYEGGKDNVIEISGGFHHYSIGLSKWGISDEQVITLSDLYNERADGPQPTTYVLGGEVVPRKLVSRTSSMEIDGQSGMIPNTKVEYQYHDHGRVSKLIHFEYNGETKTFQPKRYFNFAYENNQLTTIKGYHQDSDDLYITETYEYYANGNVAKIIQKNAGGYTSTVELTYGNAEKITALYSNWNGQGFTYQFDYTFKNITAEKTTKGAQTCSEGTYEYDKNINPLKHQGYVDFFLTNLSINNRTVENVNYTACAFPELEPQTYQYQYNDLGYPTKVTVNYKGGRKSQIQYYYE